jgi:hypothetical protein
MRIGSIHGARRLLAAGWLAAAAMGAQAQEASMRARDAMGAQAQEASMRARDAMGAQARDASVQPQAGSADAPDAMQTVEVTGVRDPAMLPYPKAYELLSALDSASGQHVAMRFRVLGAKTGQPVPGLVITLKSASVDERLPISPEGLLSLPLNKTAYDEGGELTSNRRKGTLKLGVSLTPRLPDDGVSYGYLRESIKLAREARRELLPWYLRLVTPDVGGVGLCFAESGRRLSLRGAGGELRELATDGAGEDDMGTTLHCHVFTGAESGMALDDTILPAPGMQAVFL